MKLFKLLRRIREGVLLLCRFGYIMRKLDWKLRFNENAKYIVWIPELFTFRFINNSVAVGLARYKVLQDIVQEDVSIYWRNDIGKFTHKIVFYQANRFDKYHFYDYAFRNQYVIKQLMKQKNIVYPRYGDMKYWENKVYMHEKFTEFGINTPKTRLATSFGEALDMDFDYPFLVKEAHSAGGHGVYVITDSENLKSVLTEQFFARNAKAIIQEILNMRRDIRVIIIGKKVVSHYWRINPGDTWNITSTEFGATVDFDNFPVQWEEDILKTTEKLAMDVAAYDIAWQNDDLDSPPIYLEVSPAFSPNPPTSLDFSKEGFSYGEWKHRLTLKENFGYRWVDTVFQIQEEYVEHILQQNHNDSKIVVDQ